LLLISVVCVLAAIVVLVVVCLTALSALKDRAQWFEGKVDIRKLSFSIKFKAGPPGP
jgi:hypothetical protein